MESNSKVSLVVDCSHSATHVYPIFNGVLMTEGVRRLDIGGKLMTKLLAKMISFKQFRMEGYFHTVNKMKEEVCYIDDCCSKALDNYKEAHTFYVLPDPDIGRAGYMTNEKDQTGVLQMLNLSKERFIIPEAIFNPQM
jgi:actin-related protein 6